MFRLTAILFVLISVVFAGIVVTALLSLNMFDASRIALGALLGAVLAIPISWLVAKQIMQLTQD